MPKLTCHALLSKVYILTDMYLENGNRDGVGGISRKCLVVSEKQGNRESVWIQSRILFSIIASQARLRRGPAPEQKQAMVFLVPPPHPCSEGEQEAKFLSHD